MDKRTVMLAVTTDNPDVLTRAFETMARAAAGLAMENIPVAILSNKDTSKPLGGD